LKQEAPTARNQSAAISAMDSLRSHETMAAIMPALMRIAAIQKDCSTALPVRPGTCEVLRFDAGQLTLSAPNSAMAARLKQQLPKLQDTLCASGWQVSAIRLKVQAAKKPVESMRSNKAGIPPIALSAFSTLESSLEKSSQNDALKAAINAMVLRHRRQQ